MLTTYLLYNGYKRGVIDNTLFIKESRFDLILAQVYVYDIIFASTNEEMRKEFADVMLKKFEMSMIGELTFFLGLQVKQQPKGIFISQCKYLADMLKKFSFIDCKPTKTLMSSPMKISNDSSGADVNPTLYRRMIGYLLYLIVGRPDIMFLQPTCMFDIRKIQRSHIFSLSSTFFDT